MLVVPSISPTSSAFSAPVSVTSSVIQWSLQLPEIATKVGAPVLLLPPQRQLLQISNAAITPASGAVPAVYTTVEETAVVRAGTIHNLDLSDASKLLLLYFSLLQYL